MPARETRIRTSPPPGSGVGRSASFSTSGPPNSSIWIARMRWQPTGAKKPRSAAGAVDSLPALMGLTVVGSIAFDAVKTPFGERERMLGGSAVHFSLAASFFIDVRVVGPVGEDFGVDEESVLTGRGIETSDIERVAGGQTFFW